MGTDEVQTVWRALRPTRLSPQTVAVAVSTPCEQNQTTQLAELTWAHIYTHAHKKYLWMRFSATDQLFIINQIIKRANEYSMKISLMFVDYNKAFDTVLHEYLRKAMQNEGVSEKFIRTVGKKYEKSKA